MDYARVRVSIPPPPATSQRRRLHQSAQVLFLMYHYFAATKIYNAIRMFIAAYVWMTGFGNFSYYYIRKDLSIRRLAMGVETPKQNAPKIVMLNTAFKLAESWVDNMSKSVDDEPTQTEPVKRPDRLGLGAKVAGHSKLVPSDDPVEKRLHAKLNAGKRRVVKNAEEETPTQIKDASSSDEDEDDNLESRTKYII